MRTNEKLKKGRKTLNAASGLGLRKGGLTIKTCSLIFWSIVVPVATYASELWVLKENDICLLDAFQRYAGRRVQRFHPRSPNETSFAALGWIRLETFIYIKKLLFVRTVAKMKDGSIYKQVFLLRSMQFDGDMKRFATNEFDSPIFDILRTANIFGLYREVMGILHGARVYSKVSWRELIWRRAWQVEDEDWNFRTRLFMSTLKVKTIMGVVSYLTWWQLSDEHPNLMRICEVMAKLVCNASCLKADDKRTKGDPTCNPWCKLCDDYAVEDARHLIMHCTYFEKDRTNMFRCLESIDFGSSINPVYKTDDIFYALLGKIDKDAPREANVSFMSIAGRAIYNMYNVVLRNKIGVG